MLLTPKEIKNIRRVYGMNQVQFGRFVGLSTPYINLLESGKVPVTPQVTDKIRDKIKLNAVRYYKLTHIMKDIHNFINHK